jgi:hypothetical protein
MSKFPVKPDVIITYIQELSNNLNLDLIEKILTVVPNEEVKLKIYKLFVRKILYSKHLMENMKRSINRNNSCYS